MVSRLKINSKTNNKSNYLYDNITIDAKHNEMIHYFNSLHESVPSLKDELKKLVNEYNNKDSSKKHDIEYILYRDNIKEKIYDLKDRINRIINNDDINKYYLEVGTLLHNYYENVEYSKTNENINAENFEENLLNYDDYFDSIEEDDEDDIDKNEDNKLLSGSKTKNNTKDNTKNILNFFNTEIKSNDSNINSNTMNLSERSEDKELFSGTLVKENTD